MADKAVMEFVITESGAAPGQGAEPSSAGPGIADFFAGAKNAGRDSYAQQVFERLEKGKKILFEEVAGSLEAALAEAAKKAKFANPAEIGKFIDDFQRKKLAGRSPDTPTPGRTSDTELDRIAKDLDRQMAEANKFNPDREARKQIDAEERKRQIAEAKVRLSPPKPERLPDFHGQELPFAVPEELAHLPQDVIGEALRKREAKQAKEDRAKQLAHVDKELESPTLKSVPTVELADQGKPGRGMSGFGRIPGMHGMGGMFGQMVGPEAMAAAGPIGMAMAAKQMIEKQLKEMIARPAELAELGAASTKGLAKNEMGGLTKPLEELGPVFGEVAKSANRIGKAFDDASDAFLARAREISMFSGQLAVSTAMADVNKMRIDMREAQELGPGLSRLTDAKSQLDSATAEALMPIKKVVVEMLANAAENLTDFINFVKPFIAANAEILKNIMEAIGEIRTTVLNVLLDIAGFFSDDLKKMIKDMLNKQRRQTAIPIIDMAAIRSNNRQEKLLEDIRERMLNRPAFGVPRMF